MMHITTEDLNTMERIYRGNLINSVTGFKSANLLATKSVAGVDNVAVFSSVTHLGSNPPLFSFIQRPLGHGVGHTYENLKETGLLTLYHIHVDLVDAAHQSSAKYDASISEFEKLGIDIQMRDGFEVPFVKNARIQVAAQYESEYYLKENKCIMVICRITDIFISDKIQTDDGWLNLEKAGSVAIDGLDGYASAKIEKRLSYAKVGKKLEELDLGS